MKWCQFNLLEVNTIFRLMIESTFVFNLKIWFGFSLMSESIVALTSSWNLTYLQVNKLTVLLLIILSHISLSRKISGTRLGLHHLLIAKILGVILCCTLAIVFKWEPGVAKITLVSTAEQNSYISIKNNLCKNKMDI